MVDTDGRLYYYTLPDAVECVNLLIRQGKVTHEHPAVIATVGQPPDTVTWYVRPHNHSLPEGAIIHSIYPSGLN